MTLQTLAKQVLRQNTVKETAVTKAEAKRICQTAYSNIKAETRTYRTKDKAHCGETSDRAM